MGVLGMQMVAAQSIVYQYFNILFAFAWGIGMTSGIRIGQNLGANNPKAAQLTSRVTLITAVLTGFVFFLTIISLHNQLPHVFTADREIIDLAASVLPIIAVQEIFDYLGASMNGILRGCGRQMIGTYITVPAFSFVLIVGLTLMLKTPLMIKGFWMACLCGLVFQSLVGTWFVVRLNWKDEAEKAQLRVGRSGERTSVDLETMKTPMLAETSKKLTKKIVLLRVLTFGVSIGLLIISLIIRFAVHIPDETVETHLFGNSTIEAWGRPH